MTDPAKAPARFIGVVGWLFLVAAALGLFISAGQVVLLFEAASDDRVARAFAFGLALASSLVAVVSRSFLRRRRWARAALVGITALGLFASLMQLLFPTPALESPPDAPAEYVQTLRLISVADVIVPLAACLAFGWLLWRLQSPAVRDQFH